MILYLMRHGIAEDISSTGRDADRVLSTKGTLRTAMVARALGRMELTFDRIISSPYARARQTAEIVARVTGFGAEILFDQRIVPHAGFDEFCDMLRENDDANSALITGHEPSMSRFISGLSAGGHLMIDVKKASVTAIQLLRLRPQPAGALLWSLPPRVFDSVA
ncbi:MAG: phosphohistidine phosphatase SixA [Bacteroidetes bacterium]|nr:phosphohistidine phosphatase SixA [Bacteroidota bacterium]